MVINRDDHLMLVVNAACKTDDEAHLRQHLSDVCEIEPLTDRALLALQGPTAEGVLSRLDPAAAAMRFMQVADLVLDGIPCVVSRSDRKSTRLTSSHSCASRMPSSAC